MLNYSEEIQIEFLDNNSFCHEVPSAKVSLIIDPYFYEPNLSPWVSFLKWGISRAGLIIDNHRKY